MIISSWISGVGNTLTSQKRLPGYEGFQSANFNLSGFLFWLYLLFIVVSAVGAAYLSWTLNTYLGTSMPLSILYAVGAFLFSDFYYPMYAFFLNPISSGKANNNGRRNNYNNGANRA